MVITWSRNAKREFSRIDIRYQHRIEEKLSQLDDKTAPQPDVKKLALPEDHYRLRVGDYRIIFTTQEGASDSCYIVAVKRRTSTTYMHEENMPYGNSIY